MSVAGTDVDVVAGSIETVALASVHATYGNSTGYAGFSVTPLMFPLTVQQVAVDGPAQTAALEVGDVITSLDGMSTQGMLPQGLTIAARDHATATLTLGIFRAGVSRTIEVVVTSD